MADHSDDEEKPNNNNDSRLRMSKNVTLAVKLNGNNYPLWQKLMRIAVVGRRALRHLTGIPAPPEPGAKGYTEWEETELQSCNSIRSPPVGKRSYFNNLVFSIAEGEGELLY